MNNKLKMLVMSLVMQGFIKKYAKANVFFAFAYYLFAFAEFYFAFKSCLNRQSN